MSEVGVESSTPTHWDLESVRLASAQDMHRGAWRGLLRHGDELLERGDLCPLPPFGRVGGRRAARVAKGKLEGAVVVVMDRDRRLRLDKLDHLDALLGVHRYQQQAK